MSNKKSLSKQNLNQFKEEISSLKLLCNQFKIPMFLSYAIKNDDGELKYFNEIVSASLEMPGYAKRINKLILAVNDCDTKLPEHIQQSVNVLSEWLDKEKEFTDSDSPKIDKFRNYADIVNGQIEATIPDGLIHSVEDYEEVITRKKND